MKFKGFDISEGDKLYSTAAGAYGTVIAVSDQINNVTLDFGRGAVYKYHNKTGKERTGRADRAHWHSPLVLEPCKSKSAWQRKGKRLRELDEMLAASI